MKLYGYCFEDGKLEKQEVEILKETNKYYVVGIVTGKQIGRAHV